MIEIANPIASQLDLTKVRTGSTTTMQMDGSNGDANGEEFADELQALSRKHWLVEGKKKRPKFQPKVVDQIFQGLSERSFPLRELVVLDQSQYLEKYVDP
jgi:Intron-binding protein aquarius N-terminus